MAETAVAQTSAPQSAEERIMSLLGDDDAPSQPSPAESPASPQAASDTEQVTDELTPDDLPADDAPAPATTPAELELNYSGEPVKVSLDEAKNLAQLGYHVQKAQQRVESELAAAQQAAQQIQQLAQAAQQTIPQIRQVEAQMAALQARANEEGLTPQAIYQVALSDPARAQEMQARLNLFAAQYQQAQHHLGQLNNQFVEQQKGLDAEAEKAEFALLRKIHPAVNDPVQFDKLRQTVTKSLEKLRPQTQKAITTNAELLAMAHKAAQYDALQAGKRDKLANANAAPAVSKPGAPNQMDPKTRQMLDDRKSIKAAKTPTDKARAIERYFENRF